MIVTRFAPSPTGSLHIGGIRSALISYALARHSNGKFFLRIEDTDRNRFVDGSEKEIEDMLKLFGLDYDEKYKQSERLEIYKEYAIKLVESGNAYYCFHTKEEIDEMRKKAHDEKKTFVFRSTYRDLPIDEAKKMIDEGKKYVIRQKLPDNHVVVFDDGIQGVMSFNTNDIDETVLLKSDGFPTYHLAVVVDDHLMNVTHVLRGVEWLPSVAKHVLLYKAFGFEMPVIGHLPVILDPEGGKLSKRKGSVSAIGFIKEGYLPEAILNFLMLLGWASPVKYEHGEKEREIFSLKDFIDLIELKDVNKHSPVFNRDKLKWFNQKYIQSLSADNLTNRFINWFKDYSKDIELKEYILKIGPDKLQKILLLEQNRIHIFSELLISLKPFFIHNGNYDLTSSKQTKNLNINDIKLFLVKVLEFLNTKSIDLLDLNHQDLEVFVRNYAEEKNIKAGSLFMVIRLALLESPFSPPLIEVMQILEKTEVINRIKKYC